MVRYGYACINRTLREQNVRTNKDMNKSTFVDDDDLEYTGELCVRNLQGILRVLKWNVEHDIYVFRMTSMPFPWFTEWHISELPNEDEVRAYADDISQFVDRHDIRLTMHPGHYCCLASPTDSTADNARQSLRAHGQFMDLLGLERSPYNAINIHIGGTYDCKADTLDRFLRRYRRLPDTARSRLVVENDDTPSQYSVQDLYGLSRRCGIPITFDYHHHRCHPGDLTEREALHFAALTWDERQLTHYSEPHPDKDRKAAHSEHIDSFPDSYGLDFDCIVEAKGKEEALFVDEPVSA